MSGSVKRVASDRRGGRDGGSVRARVSEGDVRWRFDNEGYSRDPKLTELLHTLGGEVARAARQFSRRAITTPEAARAEAQLQPITKEEVAASQKR
jgi:hypothetical protein